MRKLLWAVAALAALTLSGCGYNDFQTKDEQVKAAWAEVLNQYKRRADLIPNLVNTVKGYAQHEERVLTEVTNARAKVGSTQLTTDDLNNPEKLKQFQAAQGELSSALSRLMVVTENYPNLKSDQSFRDLQAQLEGTENRIAVERMRFNEVAQAFNTKRSRFPTVLFASLFGSRFAEKPYFQAQPGADVAPKVKF